LQRGTRPRCVDRDRKRHSRPDALIRFRNTYMSLQDSLDTFKADFEGRKTPPGVVEVIQQATAALSVSRQAARALQVGAHGPAFYALTQRADLSIGGFDARGPLALTFYRGVGQPYCNMELQGR
jgi:hypothetical protein